MPEPETKRIYRAIFEARGAGLDSIRPGAEGCMVDHRIRNILQSHGFGPNFTHASGHGVGFAAVDHNAPPRIHPASDDVLEPGMIFNMEPAVYIPGKRGIRHCDMVLVTDAGADLLTDFLSDLDSLTVM